MTIHNDVLEAFEQIDAAMFSGDTFIHHEGREKLRKYLERWNKWNAEHCYYAADGTLMNANGTRSIFDDVDE